MALPFLASLSLLLHAYLAWRLLPALGGFPVASTVLGAVLMLSMLLVPMGLVARRVAKGQWADWLTWAGLLFMGLFSSLFVLAVLRDAGLLALAALGGLGWDWAQQILPTLRVDTALAVPLLGLLATVLGFWNARRTAQVVHVDVPIAALPAALHGFTVAQITDVHVGPTIKTRYLQAIVRRVNALDADMVAITGDLVDGSVADLGSHVAALKALTSRHGSYFVTGNHEYYSGAHAWIAELRRLSVQVLMNEHVVLQRGGASLVLAGVADFHADRFDVAHRSDPHAALAGAPLDAGVRVLLAHQPRSAFEAAKAGFDVQLSGHTRTAGSFGRGICLCRCSSPSPPGCASCKTCGCTPAVARVTGARPNGLVRRARLLCCGW